jgi:hypothetical protein
VIRLTEPMPCPRCRSLVVPGEAYFYDLLSDGLTTGDVHVCPEEVVSLEPVNAGNASALPGHQKHRSGSGGGLCHPSHPPCREAQPDLRRDRLADRIDIDDDDR